MIPKEGQYYYARHRNRWGVWKAGKTSENGVRMDDFISDFFTQIQAANFCRKMNNNNIKNE